MKRFTCILLVFILISTSFFTFNVTGENEKTLTDSNLRQYENGYRYNIQGWIYLHIEGEPYERGYQHGYLLANEIVDMINRWSNMIHNQPTIKKLDKFISEEKYHKISEVWWNFCKKECFKIYKDKYEEYPEYKQEIQGIADGAKSRGAKVFGRDVTYEDILTCNQMYEFLSKYTVKKLRRGFHPLLTLFKNLKEVEPNLGETNAASFISDFTSLPRNHKCNGFAVVGDATSNGQLVFANSMWSTDLGYSLWWFTYYITFRWSIILDIKPSNGNRIIMASAPGYIWSDHDYYQNDAGITLLETTVPQGLWDNKGLPLVIRARRAMQYGNSIEDVMSVLKYRNDGAMNAVWLIGDAKTGEIARFELGYRNSWYNTTSNGFQWSANNPFNLRVRMEKFNLKDFLKSFLFDLILKSKNFAYNSIIYHPAPRDIKYEEFGNEHYGSLDIDLVKELMSNDTIAEWSPDCKITNSHLLENNGLWVFIGNPAGWIRDIYNVSDKNLKIEKIPPAGWVRLYGLPDKKEFNLLSKEQDFRNQTEIVWTHDTHDNQNTFQSSSIIVGDVLYSTTSTGEINALSCYNGTFLWNRTIGDNPTTPLYYDNKIFVGTSEGLKIIDLETMKQREKPFGKILSCPVAADGKVIVGNENGDVYAIDAQDSEAVWHISLPDEIYISEPWNNYLFIASGKNCYAVDIDSGKVAWFFETNGMITSKPYCYDGVVYFGSWDTFVYALNANSGQMKWKYETGWGVETTPVVSDGLVLFGSLDNNFYALDKDTGNIQWFFTCKSAIHSSPVVYGEYVFFGCDDGRFYAVDKKTGDAAWFFAPGFTIDNYVYNYITTPILSDPVVYKGVVYIGAKGNIYALDTQTIEKTKSSEINENEQANDAWFFLIVLLAAIVLITAIFIYFVKERQKK